MAGKSASEKIEGDGGFGVPVLQVPFRLLGFLDRWFTSIPRRQRGVAYFILLALFVATTWRVTAGQYAVHGVIWNGDEYATTCEVRLRSDYFSTNSKGMYYAVLAPSQYFRFLASGAVRLPVACRTADGQMKNLKGPFEVQLSWWDDEFSEIFLDAPAPARQASEAPASFSFSLSAPAFAQPVNPAAARPANSPAPVNLDSVGLAARPPLLRLPSLGDRLIVNRVQLGGSAKEMRRVEFEIDLGKEDRPLLLGGAEAGKLPMKPMVELGETYYFDVPQARQGRKVSIEMEASGWFGPKEEFEFRLPAQYNALLVVRGSKGSTLELRLAPRTPTPP